ncbi:hypothetical protein Tco_1529777 [Tanacetum coccineum]
MNARYDDDAGGGGGARNQPKHVSVVKRITNGGLCGIIPSHGDGVEKIQQVHVNNNSVSKIPNGVEERNVMGRARRIRGWWKGWLLNLVNGGCLCIIHIRRS